MSQSCPISFKRIDTNFVRIVAVQVIIVALLLVLTQEVIFAFILLFDFSVRILNLKKLSIFAHIAKLTIKQLNLEAKFCDEAPKRFALQVGIIIISLFTLLYLLDFNLAAAILVNILLLCAFLEASFDYCVGCKVYHILQYLLPKK